MNGNGPSPSQPPPTASVSGSHSICWEEDKPIVAGVLVRAATVESLVDTAIDNESETAEGGAPYLNVLFLMHRWFSNSQRLAEIFVERFDLSPGCGGRSSGGEATPSDGECRCQGCNKRSRICHVLSYWIRHYPIQFDSDRNLASLLHAFHVRLRDGACKQWSELVDLSNVPSYHWMHNMSVRDPGDRMNRKVSLVYNHLEPKELAEHLTYLEHKAMQRIGFQDFKNYAMSGSLKDNPKLERSIFLFNCLSQWIQSMVLSKTTPEQRAEVIVKFVEVAKKLKEFNNYNTLMAVVGGLSHSALARLSKTVACVPPETQKVLHNMEDLLSSASNFSNYRKALSESKGFRIPILGVHMKDLISLHVALPDCLENELVNFRKMAQLSLIFQELAQLQNSTPPYEVNMDLVKTLRLSLDFPYSEDEIYELSLAREPRNSVSPQSSPTKPTVFADWAAGVSCPPDPETIERHVNAMVEAVYKNYDNDKDGCISQEEFEAISGNFPFIDSFCVLDADQNGVISKDEMKDYFYKANVCQALRSGFKHGFHETTYFKPTYCAHCMGLLWGLIRQGYKCRDCGINAHKHCKDLVVMECRRFSSSSRSNSMPSSDGVQIRNKFRHRRRQPKAHTIEGDVPPSSPRLSGSGSSSGTGTSNGTNSSMISNRDSQSQVDSFLCGHEDLLDRLAASEEARLKLAEEKQMLQIQYEAAQKELGELRQYVSEIRQHTVDFILCQMETLKIQKDTPV